MIIYELQLCISCNQIFEKEGHYEKKTVTRVIEGDTFMTGSMKRPIRLANVHAPEKGNRGAGAATQASRQLVEGKTGFD